jgi:phosphoribosylanthranilate isomerase
MNVKICGITNLEDAHVAVEAGADLLGFICYARSPRYVEPETIAEIIDRLNADLGARASRRPRYVGVFVDETVRQVHHLLETCGLDLAQLHGSEPPVEVRALQPHAFKAIRPRQRGDAEATVSTYAPVMQTALAATDRPAFLIDAYHPWRFGGTGEITDWIAAKVVARRYPILLAGGLTRTNVAEAVRIVEPWGVDVSSGVESEPGRKDHDEVRAFVQAAKTSDAARSDV